MYFRVSRYAASSRASYSARTLLSFALGWSTVGGLALCCDANVRSPSDIVVLCAADSDAPFAPLLGGQKTNGFCILEWDIAFAFQ